MKRIATPPLHIAIILFSIVWINSCAPDENFQKPELSLDQILAGKEITVYNGMLTFKDKKGFDQLTLDLAKRDEAYIRSWENQLGFKSLYSIYEDVISEEEKFLNEMVKKYGESSEVTRNEIGYSKLTQTYLEKGVIIETKEGILDMNITIPVLAPLINADGFVRIGNDIRQYKSDYVRIIQDGDYDKMVGLEGLKESVSQIHVGPVVRDLKKISDESRTQAISSCDVTNGSHRLIAYEEKTYVNEGGSPCPVYRNDYYVRLRSLKKILGTWQNFKTSQFTLTATYVLNHLNCDYSVKIFSVSWRNNNFFAIGGNWHTFDVLYLTNYNTGPCVSSTVNCNGPGILAFDPGATRYFLATGVNSTQCDLP